MNLPLNGKRALVIGSTTGIGLAIATELADAGAEVVLNGRDQARLDQALRQVRERVPAARIIGVVADLGSEAGYQVVIERVPHTDVLVGNLSIRGIGEQQWARLACHYGRGMAERKWGRVVMVGSALNPV